jgi:uncharacterized membrane protein
MQGGTYPSVDWSATALLNGVRYLVASLLFGVLGFFLSSELSPPERLAQGLSMAIAFGFLYALNLVLLLSLRWKYDNVIRSFAGGLYEGMRYGARLFSDTRGDLVTVTLKWTVGLFIFAALFTLVVGLLLMRVAASASDPILYLLKRTGLLPWLPDGYPLFSWSFYFLVEQ